MMQTIPYGEKELSFSIANGRSMGTLVPASSVPHQSPPEIVADCIANPLDTPRLREIAQAKTTAAILIAGKARRTASERFVPALIDELNTAGIPDSKVEIFLADGTHQQHVERDIIELLGAEVAGRVRCLGHDCRKSEELVDLGSTSRGTPVFFNRRVMAADVKILTGRIVPHYFAGFSGGRKALLPGVAGWDTILANHRLTLATEQGIHPAAAPGRLDENPIHLDMVEAARLAKPDFCFNTLLDGQHRLISAFCGQMESVHDKGCRRAQEMFRITLPDQVDAVVTSAGGIPYDCNLMQALKAPFNVQNIVRTGGAMLWVARCTGGMHPGFLEWARIKSDASLNDAARANYKLTAHNSIMLRQLVRRINVALISDLPPGDVRALGLEPVLSLEEGIRWLSQKCGSDFTYAVVPWANIIYAELD